MYAKPIRVTRIGERSYTIHVNGVPLVSDGKSVNFDRIAAGLKGGRGWKAPLVGTPTAKFTSKKRAESISHSIGRYILGLGDLVFSYVDHVDGRDRCDSCNTQIGRHDFKQIGTPGKPGLLCRRCANLQSHFVAAFRFFQAHAGGAVGHNAETALRLARAEAYADAAGWTVTWEHDECADFSDHHEWCTIALRARREEREAGCNHEVLCAVLKDASGTVLESLAGIIGASRDYARVVAAELALEAMPR